MYSFPPATLIRLYELLKNSRLIRILINNKEASFEAALVLMNQVPLK
jgi:hypothetical protein